MPLRTALEPHNAAIVNRMSPGFACRAVTVDPFTGEVHVLFVAKPGKSARPVSGLERKRNSPTRLFRLEVLRKRHGRRRQGE